MSSTPEQDKFNKLWSAFRAANVPLLPARTAQQWDAFDRTPEGIAHKELTRKVRERFYSLVNTAINTVDNISTTTPDRTIHPTPAE